MDIDTHPAETDVEPEVATVLTRLSAERFRTWHQEREYRQNIEDGKPYFNGASSIPESKRHSPSQLLQCHRKIVYRQENAPEETGDPKGIFWFGTRFEEDVIVPFFREALTADDTYVRNTVWIDTTVETGVGEVRIKGATDPLIVDGDAVPILPSEIKTKSSLDHVDTPNRHHRAQLHAYMHGLSQKYDIKVTDGVIVYGARDSLDIEIFHVEFDQDFWTDTVLDWAGTHTEYRLDNQLPPATAEYGWECEFCSYRERCGQGESAYEDSGVRGLIPTIDYPREKLVKYFDAHPQAQLPPSLAEKVPDLTTEHGVYDWRCQTCGHTMPWSETASQESVSPACPDCSANGVYAEMAGPSPKDQRRLIVEATEDEPGLVEGNDA